MVHSVQSYCNLLVRSRLLAPDEARALFQRWQREAGEDAVHVGRFAQWLVGNGQLTTYQASRLSRGRTEGYFLDQYKVLDKIEHGPFAGLFRAVHQLGQVVTVKVLSPNKSRQPRLAARFLNEARLALRLKHPNVIRGFQVGQATDRYFLVMEHLEGETLADVLRRRGQLPPAEAVRLIHQALCGLQHLHEQGIIHRDLKPANLLLIGPTPSPGQLDTTLQATVKIVDIDLGRGAAQAGAEIPPSAPIYPAPELFRDSAAADIRADIYSLGCVLYQCLAGRPPFQESNLANLMVSILNEEPRPLKELNPAVPDGLQQIVNWMMAKDPAQRYPTPERAGQALQVFLAAGTEPVAAPGTDPRMRSYLNWLETSEHRQQATEPSLPPAPAPEQPERRHKKRRTEVKPAAAPPPPEPAGFDVELVPYEHLPQPRPRTRALTELDRRDFLMLAFGGGGALFAVFFGWLLARLLRRTPETEE